MRAFHTRLVKDIIQLKKTMTDNYIKKIKDRYVSWNEERDRYYKIPVQNISKKSIIYIPFILKNPKFKNDILLVDYDTLSLGMVSYFDYNRICTNNYVHNNMYDYLFTSENWVLFCKDEIRNIDSSKDVYINSIEILNQKNGKLILNGLFCDHFKNRYEVTETCTNHFFKTTTIPCKCSSPFRSIISGIKPGIIAYEKPCEYCNK